MEAIYSFRMFIIRMGVNMQHVSHKMHINIYQNTKRHIPVNGSLN